jgi:mannose-1-phosphate guanylyltransferase
VKRSRGSPGVQRDKLDHQSSAPVAIGGRRWAVILAGGDGTRLQGLTRFICGDDRPKQFCPLIGGQSLLAHTIRRAERSVPHAQILFALTRTHRQYYNRELKGLERRRIVQPANRGTAPPILFSVRSIAQMDENALVAILPSDHHFADESRFINAVESAFAIAARQPESIVLVGAEPDRLELEYGWIELGAHLANRDMQVHRVRGFWEKPSIDIARKLMRKDSAWNTFVMIGHVRAFLELSARTIPDVLEAVGRARPWHGAEARIEESAYEQVRCSDFSRHVLSAAAARLLVLRVSKLGWSDLGHPERVVAAIERNGVSASWIRAWIERKRPGMAPATAVTATAVA